MPSIIEGSRIAYHNLADAYGENEEKLWVHLLAYNLIQLLMAQSACMAGVEPRTLSYKHTCQL